MDLNNILKAGLDAAAKEIDIKTGDKTADAVVNAIVDSAIDDLGKSIAPVPLVSPAPLKLGKDYVTYCFDFVMRMEGGYVNNPNDRGGATNLGVTQRVYDAYRAGKKLSKQDVRKITKEEAKTIFIQGYWTVCGCPYLPAATALAVIDFAFNSGTTRALRYLNMAAVKPLEYAAKHGDKELALKLTSSREVFFRNIVAANPSQKVFLKGWMNRIAAMEAAIKAMY